MKPCLVTLKGELVYEAFDCDEAYMQLRHWFMKNYDNINTLPADKKLQVVDMDSERVIRRGDKGYYLAEPM